MVYAVIGVMEAVAQPPEVVAHAVMQPSVVLAVFTDIVHEMQ
jgi:hypothetical protein